MKNLTKQQIISASDFKIERVEVPEWDGAIHLKSMSVAEGIAFEKAKEGVDNMKIVPLLLTFVLCNENGERVFQEKELETLLDKAPHVLLRLFEHASKLNNMTEEAHDETEAFLPGEPPGGEGLRDGVSPAQVAPGTL